MSVLYILKPISLSHSPPSSLFLPYTHTHSLSQLWWQLQYFWKCPLSCCRDDIHWGALGFGLTCCSLSSDWPLLPGWGWPSFWRYAPLRNTSWRWLGDIPKEAISEERARCLTQGLFNHKESSAQGSHHFGSAFHSFSANDCNGNGTFLHRNAWAHYKEKRHLPLGSPSVALWQICIK